MSTNRNGAVIYRGPSLLEPLVEIAVVLTGLLSSSTSSNRKTGAMVQSWIIRTDMAPHVARKTGADVAICGDCPFRDPSAPSAPSSSSPTLGALGITLGGCYVLAWQAPRMVWQALTAGNYPTANRGTLELVEGRPLRVGSYGEPTAAPLDAWRPYLDAAPKRTGYTHQWRQARFAAWRPYLMASTETLEGYNAAISRGWRAFHVGSTLPEGAIWCPATAEGGERTTCERCALCRGAHPTARNVAAAPHGAMAKRIRGALVELGRVA